MGSQFNLADVLRERTPTARERMLVAERIKTRSLHPGQPLTGAWYWVPAPDGQGRITWNIQEFYDLWQPSSDHVYIWKYVLDSLQHLWGRSLPGIEYCSLPRGRVSQMLVSNPVNPEKPVFAIYHGNDSPVGKRGLAKVRQAFQLPAEARVIFDEHERCIAGQPQALSLAIGYDLGIEGVSTSELDWDED